VTEADLFRSFANRLPPGVLSTGVSDSRRGLIHGIAAYFLWGIAPLFWKLLRDVSWVEILAHRVVWGVIAFGAIVAAVGVGPVLRAAARDRGTLAAMALSGAMLAINWGMFIWAVARGHILDASLGYFIIPLISVGLGMLVLGERLRRLQWLAIAFSSAGVVVESWRAGGLPWISLVLATSFGLYGLVRKTARVEALVGSTLETMLLAPLAAAYLAVIGGGVISLSDPGTALLLLGTGAVTALPLVLFTSAARRLPLSTVGFLQYLTPTGQFLLATLAYGEPVAPARLAAFGLIWIGLALFSFDLARA